MSIERTETITCPECGRESEFVIWQSLNTMLDPNRKEEFLSGDLFRFTCSGCGYTSKVNYPMLYHQMEDHIMIYYIQEEDEIQKTIDMLTGAYFKSNDDSLGISGIMKEAAEEYLYRVVLSQNEMIEKAHIFDQGKDDRIIELMKVFVMGKIYNDNPEIEDFKLLYAVEDGEESFVMMGEDNILGVIGFSEGLYDALEKDFHDRLRPLRGGSDYLVDYDWAAEMLGLESDTDKD